MKENALETFDRLESRVRSYCRSFPALFERAEGACLFDVSGRRYIDFLCGAGTLSYGHNHPAMKAALLEYLGRNGIVHGLDLATDAKRRFIECFERTVLRPQGLNYRLQFTGPTGANAVEAALKLARLVKRRRNVIAFTNSYHGLSSGALAVTASMFHRNPAYVSREDVAFMPFDGFLGEGVDTMNVVERMLAGHGSGIDLPAAVIVETVQGEGGVNVAAASWLQRLATLCRNSDVLLIVDDIQAGCGRTGSFFSFQRAGIRPDLVVLSKALSGFGLPMSLVLLDPELDQWQPGEHSGTFRGNNLAFVTAVEALRLWESDAFTSSLAIVSLQLAEALGELPQRYPGLDLKVRGLGMMHGIEVEPAELARPIAQAAFDAGLIIELCGPRSNVLKLLPPLTIDPATLREGLAILDHALGSIDRTRWHPGTVAVVQPQS
ncbi:diaminobutyrate--2-oxoglutarate transaminase [Variovorax sp. J22R115]|uniref:diaminobutyrate--2-oxoglutarate transaminase n=1 Tax=Variovorax sp. J22R115 TaxID=3053509 RepID=UPI002578B344|nr:diaminobutyrate--2-oxoglutarate transaminase [Variovorax sp. J22R115]MDM0053052.1 diaminobutyrate--2-oxoglutarate transaminase [Variovorax sp. J22R115]